MKAISLWQPWASAIANGVKTIETRSWSTNYRGPIAIHAASKRTGDLVAIFDGLLHDYPNIERSFWAAGHYCFADLPLGQIVCVVTIRGCIPVDGIDMPKFSKIQSEERALGNYTKGRFAWLLTDPKKLGMPLACPGRQGFFNLPPAVKAKIREQL